MSNTKSDLDFHDFAPSAIEADKPTLSTSRVTIPISASKDQISEPQASKTILNVIQEAVGSQLATDENTSDAIQQMLWLHEKQKSKKQRQSIANSGSWGLGYLAQYFDVTTEDILQRLLWSAVPFRKKGVYPEEFEDKDLILPLREDSVFTNPMKETSPRHISYIERFIQSRPDFYGPFWTSATLVFSIAIISNVVCFIDFQNKHYNSENKEDIQNIMSQEAQWHYDMSQLNTAASVIIFHVTILPTTLWFLFWFRGCAKYYTISETICAYGYSLAVFVPLTLLLIVQSIAFRYVCVILASLLSGLVLVMSFLPIARSDPNPAGSRLILILVAGFQLMLAYVIHRILLP